jgi:hypothetical protein
LGRLCKTITHQEYDPGCNAIFKLMTVLRYEMSSIFCQLDKLCNLTKIMTKYWLNKIENYYGGKIREDKFRVANRVVVI